MLDWLTLAVSIAGWIVVDLSSRKRAKSAEVRTLMRDFVEKIDQFEIDAVYFLTTRFNESDFRHTLILLNNSFSQIARKHKTLKCLRNGFNCEASLRRLKQCATGGDAESRLRALNTECDARIKQLRDTVSEIEAAITPHLK